MNCSPLSRGSGSGDLVTVKGLLRCYPQVSHERNAVVILFYSYVFADLYLNVTHTPKHTYLDMCLHMCVCVLY